MEMMINLYQALLYAEGAAELQYIKNGEFRDMAKIFHPWKLKTYKHNRDSSPVVVATLVLGITRIVQGLEDLALWWTT